MSFWYEVKLDDIDIDNKDIDIILDQDNNGCIYATINVEDMLNKLKPFIDRIVEEAVEEERFNNLCDRE